MCSILLSLKRLEISEIQIKEDPWDSIKINIVYIELGQHDNWISQNLHVDFVQKMKTI